jgi:RNA polymerase sigma-70 factor (ECF subfamily)
MEEIRFPRIPDLTDLDDTELVELARSRGRRDQRPFQILVERHQTTIWRVCYGFMGNQEDAEDLTQETFVKAYRNLAGFEGRSAFRTWVYRIAINTCQNELRQRSRRPQASPTTLEVAAEFLPSSEDTESMAQRHEQYAILATAYRMLRPEDRQILAMKDLEDFPYNQIAETLEISLSAAKMRVQRARTALNLLYQQVESRWGHLDTEARL